MIHRLLFVLLLACSASALAQTTPASTPEPVSAFVAKAPEEVVEEEKAKRDGYAERLAKVREALARLA